MSVRDFIKKNIIDTGDDDHKKAASEIKTNVRPVAVPPVQSTGVVYQDSSQATKYVPVDSAFRKHFYDLLGESNLPGPDYLEFVEAKNKLAPNVNVESICYQTAFSILQGIGLTKDKIISSAQVYLGIIDKEVEGFNATFQNTYKAQVDDNNSAIAQKQQQIAKLNQEIQDLQDKVAKGNELTAKRDAFNAAGQEAKDTIQTELQKINSFIN